MNRLIQTSVLAFALLGLTACGSTSTTVEPGASGSTSGSTSGATSGTDFVGGSAPLDSEAPTAPGACCLPTGCTVLAPDACVQGGGAAVGGVCSSSTCLGDVPAPPSSGFCEDNPDEGFCDDGEEEEVACCVASLGVCTILPEEICEEVDGEFAEECEETCPDLTFYEEVDEYCDENPGTCEGLFDDEGGGEDDEDIACCFSDGMVCEQLPQGICVEEDGTPGATCAEACPDFEELVEPPWGACCFQQEMVCEELWDEACIELGGSFSAEAGCEEACNGFSDQTEQEQACCFSEEDEVFCELLSPRICAFEEGVVLETDSCEPDPCGR